MPQDQHVIATLGASSDVNIYHNDDSDAPQSDFIVLNGLEEEGFGLSWNPNQKGILTAASGTTICIWNTEEQKGGNPIVKLQNAHENTINDIKFSLKSANVFGTASDDGHYKLWDLRNPQ